MPDTLRQLDEAIQAHIASHYEGSHTDAWVLVASSVTLENHLVSNYRLVTPESQALHTDAGLIHVGRQIIRDSWDASFEDEDD